MLSIRDAPVVEVTIPSGASESEAVDLSQYAMVAIEYPAAMTGATLTFLAASTRTGTYHPVHVEAGGAFTPLTKPTTLPAIQVLDESVADLAALHWVKLKSASNEAADCLFRLLLKA